MNPDRLKKFLLPPQPSIQNSSYLRSSSKSAPGSLPSLSSSSLAGSGSLHQKTDVLQVAPIQRGELKVFQTTFRGGANLLAPPPPPPRVPGAVVAIPELSESSPDVGSQGGRSLRQVWEKSLFAHAEGLTDVDPTNIMKPTPDGKLAILRFEPDKFVMGRVLRPRVHVEMVDAAAMQSDGAHLMTPQQRRAIHDAEVNARQGHLALREAYKTKRKLALTCSINYPHGVLGCNESPYATSGLASDVYADKASTLLLEETKAQRKGRAAGAANPKAPPGTGLEVGVLDRPPHKTGRGHAHMPTDILKLGNML